MAAAEEGENTTGDVESSPVDLPPVDYDVLVAEAEKAKTTGDEPVEEIKSTGEQLPSVEFFYGKVRKDGRWIKTGKIYWIFTIYENGQRKRLSPSKIYGKRKGITSIEQCPFQGRILDFYRRSLSFQSTGDTGHDGGFQGTEESTGDKLAGK